MIVLSDIGLDAAVATDAAAATRAQRLLKAAEGIPFAPADDIPVQPLIFAAAEYQSHTAVVKRMDALLRAAAWSAGRGDPFALRAALVGDAPDHDLLTADTATERAWSSCMFRIDAVVSGGVLKVLENNVGGAIGGVNLMHELVGLHRRELAGVRGRVHFDDPFDARRLLYEDACRWVGGPPTVALLGTERETLYWHPRYWSVETDFMARHGIDARFQEPEALAAAPGEFTVALRHFMPDEWKELGINLALVRRAADAGTLMLSPESAFLLQNKKIMAWLSASEDLSPADRAFVDDHLPWTRLMHAGDVRYRGRDWHLPELVARHQADLVLKPAADYGGHDVLVGRFASAGEWSAATENALTRSDFIVQEYAAPDPVNLAFYNRASGRVRRADVTPVLGFAVFGGRDAGCVVRHNPSLSRGVVNGAQGASQNVAGWYVD